MDFSLTQEQALFKETIDRFIREQYSFEQRRGYAQEAGGWSLEVWRQLADQGFLGIPFDEAHGGLGYGAIETMLVMEALGRGLVLEPFFTTVVAAGGLLRSGASPEQLSTLIPRLASGDQVIAVATSEPQSRSSLQDVTTTARFDGSAYRLSGSKTVVIQGDRATRFLVSARSAGAQRDADGLSLFLVEADAVGLSRRAYRTQDGLRAVDLALENVAVSREWRIGGEGDALKHLERGREFAIAALAGEAVGILQALLDLTVDHLQQRRQFGGPIGRFQALQHRAAEMLIETEQARSMAIYAALMIDEPDDAERRRALSAVKIQIGKSGRIVGQLAIQLHGGIGVSEEYAVGHYFRRLMVMESLFGDQDFHLDRLAA